MAIVGVGVDVCDVARFAASLERTPTLRDRLFVPAEAAGRSVESLAARFAAKEALAKALGAPGDLAWHDCAVLRADGEPPRFQVQGTVAARVTALGGRSVHVTLSHDAGVATAFVVVEG